MRHVLLTFFTEQICLVHCSPAAAPQTPAEASNCSTLVLVKHINSTQPVLLTCTVSAYCNMGQQQPHSSSNQSPPNLPNSKQPGDAAVQIACTVPDSTTAPDAAAVKPADAAVQIGTPTASDSSDAAGHKKPQKQVSSIYDVRSNRRRNAILLVAALATMIVPCR